MAKLKEITADIEKALVGCDNLVSRMINGNSLEMQVNTGLGDRSAWLRLDLVHNDLRIEVARLSPDYKLLGSRHYKLSTPQTDKIRSVLIDKFFSI